MGGERGKGAKKNKRSLQ